MRVSRISHPGGPPISGYGAPLPTADFAPPPDNSAFQKRIQVQFQCFPMTFYYVTVYSLSQCFEKYQNVFCYTRCYMPVPDIAKSYRWFSIFKLA